MMFGPSFFPRYLQYLVAAWVVTAAQPVAAVGVLGSAANFAVLGASGVSNVGLTQISGDLGVNIDTAVVGLGSVVLDGDVHVADAITGLALIDAAAASVTLAALAFDTDLSGQDLGTVGPLSPGVYRFASSAQLTGTLTLDFSAAPASAFVFQIGSTFITASNADIVVIGGGPSSGIFWNIGSSATLGTGATVVGNFIADIAITLQTGARIVCGRALTLTAAVTIDTGGISNNCSANDIGSGRSDFGSEGFAGVTGDGPLPEPATWAMLLIGFGGIGGTLRRHRSQTSVA